MCAPGGRPSFLATSTNGDTPKHLCDRLSAARIVTRRPEILHPCSSGVFFGVKYGRDFASHFPPCCTFDRVAQSALATALTHPCPGPLRALNPHTPMDQTSTTSSARRRDEEPHMTRHPPPLNLYQSLNGFSVPQHTASHGDTPNVASPPAVVSPYVYRSFAMPVPQAKATMARQHSDERDIKVKHGNHAACNSGTARGKRSRSCSTRPGTPSERTKR